MLSPLGRRHCNDGAFQLPRGLTNLPLETFDRKYLPPPLDALVSSLAEGAFLDCSENILAEGPPSSGNARFMLSIIQTLIQRGRRVLFTPCNLLAQRLPLAKRELNLPRLLKRFPKYAVPLVGEIGSLQQSREWMEVLIALMAQQHKKGSMMITSNLPFSGWDAIFKVDMTTAPSITASSSK